MSGENAKPPYNAKRRIQLLFAFSIFLIIAASVGWYFVAGKIDVLSTQVIEQQKMRGVDIACTDKDVRGYPFRFGIFCDALSINDQNSFITFEAGSLRSAAQFYDPTQLIVELDAPANITLPSANKIRINWDQMRASTRFAQPLPSNFSAIGKNISANADRTSLQVEQLEMHMRTADNDVDLAGRGQNIKIQSGITEIDNLPPLGFDYDVRLNNAVTEIAANQFQLRGSEGTLNRAAILISQNAGAIISGPYEIDTQGLINATLNVRIIDVEKVAAQAQKTVPQLASILSTFITNAPRKGENKDEIELEISIVKSQIRLGFIPLGTLGAFTFE